MKGQTFKSDISKAEFPESERISCRLISKPVLSLIREEHPDINHKNHISVSELNAYRQKYIASYLTKNSGELNDLENIVQQSMSDDQSIVSKLNDEITTYNFGQRVADRVATFGGSWTFIIIFSVIILVWISSNIFLLNNKGFDPYPFILLNLVLSCLAALQAPIIMMSQNRQEEKDRERARNDYMVNLKSELEIRLLHEKIDHLMLHQQQEMIEIQKVQMDMMSDILRQLKN
jgi:uncharacterized membrane protein